MPYPEGMTSHSSAPNHPYFTPPAQSNSFRNAAWQDLDLVRGSIAVMKEAKKKIEALHKKAPRQSYPRELYAGAELLPAIDDAIEMLEGDDKTIEMVAEI
ncbi:hypothetical protein [Gluconacetobacter asukensis]|uniref:Uncharacterized protein n=1 Tax=Gluconacetobacter asukensis TaxID=1017181 RepID=A0A7W4P3K8_9PROT|nr:hypothetical protein [Gluconacetobacter asukensis]MBB2172845.1 hypothetical protein [Gluconacetobacter asukensis]